MRIRAASSFAIAILAATLFSAPTTSRAEDKPAPQPPKVYDSPRAVFDAYRKAVDNQDPATVLGCLTPERRDDEVFEAVFECAERADKPEVRALLKKYGIDDKARAVEYNKRYKEKHGVDLDQWQAAHDKRMEQAFAKAQAEWAANHPNPTPEQRQSLIPVSEQDSGPPAPPRDDDLLREVIFARIPDKVAFVVEASKALAAKDAPAANPIPTKDVSKEGVGELNEVVINGDKATGHVTEILYHYEAGPGKPVTRVGDRMDITWHFRKLNGGWFMDRNEPTADGAKPMIPGPF